MLQNQKYNIIILDGLTAQKWSYDFNSTLNLKRKKKILKAGKKSGVFQCFYKIEKK
jgi:hypothetical protein